MSEAKKYGIVIKEERGAEELYSTKPINLPPSNLPQHFKTAFIEHLKYKGISQPYKSPRHDRFGKITGCCHSLCEGSGYASIREKETIPECQLGVRC